MSVDELLKPRYKVIAGYPDSPYEIGQVIPITNKDGHMVYIWSDSKGDYEKYEIFFKGFPHLFKKLEWYEDREEGEIIEVKYAKDRSGRVYELSAWDIKGDVINALTLTTPYVIHVPHLFPATKEEYDSYIKLKQ